MLCYAFQALTGNLEAAQSRKDKVSEDNIRLQNRMERQVDDAITSMNILSSLMLSELKLKSRIMKLPLRNLPLVACARNAQIG